MGHATYAPDTGVMVFRGLSSSEQMVSQLLANWKAAKDDAGRQECQKQLRMVLKEQFQVRVDGHQKEIEQLEAKVKELRQQLVLRRQKEDEIVDFRLQQLLREAQGLGWGTEPGAGQVERSMNFSTSRTVIGDGGMQTFGMSGGGGGGVRQGGFQSGRMSGFGMSSGSGTSVPLGGGMGGGTQTFRQSQSGQGVQQGPPLQPTMPPAPPKPPVTNKSSQFEEFFKKLDTNGNGMLEEDEIANSPAKFIVEEVYKELGRQLKYPVAISEVLKAMDDFPGTIRIRERGDGKGNVLDRDVELNVTGPKPR